MSSSSTTEDEEEEEEEEERKGLGLDDENGNEVVNRERWEEWKNGAGTERREVPILWVRGGQWKRSGTQSNKIFDSGLMSGSKNLWFLFTKLQISDFLIGCL